MRVSSVLLGVALVACGSFVQVEDAHAAPPRRAAPAPQKKGRGPAAKPAKPEAAAPEQEASPYEVEPSGSASAAASSAPPPAEAAPEPPEGGKLDDTPPPQTSDKASGQKLSPLTPEASEMPGRAAPPGPAGLDQLMADIATLRARVAALTTSLFSSKLRVTVHTDGDDARISAFVVTLDDGVVYRADPGFIADDEKIVYEHAVAPGSHVLGIEIERQDTRGPAYRTWQTTRASITVPERKTLDAKVVVEDDSDMGADFPSDQDGEYELGVSVRARVKD